MATTTPILGSRPIGNQSAQPTYSTFHTRRHETRAPLREDLRDARSSAARRVGSYEICDEIGRGAASRVFAARHVDSAHPVAFKEFRAEPSAHVHSRFATEARILGSIDHPHVVSVRDLVEDACTRAIVMELVSRGSLRPCIRSGLGLAQAGRVLQDVLSGLAQLECQQIVHLDLKPDNLLVTSSGRVKIADFGVAQELGSVRDDEVELLGGTPQYLAPEQAAGTPLGTWTDLYAVGILAFELLVGRPPFAETQDPVDVMDRHLHDRVPKVCDLLPGISTEMTEWIDRLVEKNPSDRPRSAVEAWDGLARLLTEDVGTSWRLVSGF